MKTSYNILFILCLLLMNACHPEEGLTEGDFDDDRVTSEQFDSALANSNEDSFGENSGDPGPVLIVENPFILASEESVSTFSIDADGGAYSNCRQSIEAGNLPNPNFVRTEEFVNYFNYDYYAPMGSNPIAINGEISVCPWNEDNRLVRIGIKGKEIPESEMGSANFVLLVDVSGSMSAENKLPLIKESLKLFVENMSSEDRLAIVTYAGGAGVAMESTPGTDKNLILNTIDAFTSGGSTNGSGGIIKAYEIAEANFIEGGNNRIIMATDGDFNVGISDRDELISLIEEKRESGVFLTTIGVGSFSYNEGTLEQLANNGNGTYEFLDNIQQGQKIFIDEYMKFYTVAKDVKVQVEFDSEVVLMYRLIGYENRILEAEEFEDDTVDAGEIGAGQGITALYEVVLNSENNTFGQDALVVDFRFKMPEEETSQDMAFPIKDEGRTFEQASDNMKFAASVAGFAMLLRDSPHKGNVSYEAVKSWAEESIGYDPYGFKADYLNLIDQVTVLEGE